MCGEHTASGSTFSISPAAMLELLANEFNNHDPEDGRYATPQHRQESENSPATTGEFNRTLNVAVHEFVNLVLMKRPAQRMRDPELHKND
jgi:hypothetical protein